QTVQSLATSVKSSPAQRLTITRFPRGKGTMSRIWKSSLCGVCMLLVVSSAKAQQGPSAASPDKKLRAEGDGQAVKIVDAASGKPLRKMLGHADTVQAVAFSPDGKGLASGGRD